MHERLEQCWELKKAGKQPWHLEDEYRKIKEGKQSSDMAANTFQRGGNAPLQEKPPVDPEKLKRALDRDREAEAARRHRPHMRSGVYEFPRHVHESTFQTMSNPWLRPPPSNQSASAQAAGSRPANDRASCVPGHPPAQLAAQNHWSRNGASGTSHSSNGRPSGGQAGSQLSGNRPAGTGQSGDNTSRSHSSATSHPGSRPSASSAAPQPGNPLADSRSSGAAHSGRPSTTRSPRNNRWWRSKGRGRKSHSRSPKKWNKGKQPEVRRQEAEQETPRQRPDEREAEQRQGEKRDGQKAPERSEGWRRDPTTGRMLPVIKIEDDSDAEPVSNESSDQLRTDWTAVTDRLGGQLAEVVLTNQREIMERLDRQSALLEAQQAWIERQSLLHESVENESDYESHDWTDGQTPQPVRHHRRDARSDNTAHRHYRSPSSSDDSADDDESDEESVVYIRESDPDDYDYIQPSVEETEYDSNPSPTPTPALSPTPAPAPPRKRKALTQETSAGSASKKRVKATPKASSSSKKPIKDTPSASSSSKKPPTKAAPKAGSSAKKTPKAGSSYIPIKVTPVVNPYLAKIAEHYRELDARYRQRGQ